VSSPTFCTLFYTGDPLDFQPIASFSTFSTARVFHATPTNNVAYARERGSGSQQRDAEGSEGAEDAERG